jgi:crotonobetainyl-CoA:carnitine CoA-transferase CaiB-like acyl-CoA transferase
VGNDGQFRRFVAELGCPDLADDVRFSTNQARVENRETLIPLLQARMLERSKADWLADLEAVQVPAGPINNVAEVFAEPQIRARHMRVNVPHPDNPDLQLVGNPIKLSRTPVEYRRPPPTLGQHTEEVLARLAAGTLFK